MKRNARLHLQAPLVLALALTGASAQAQDGALLSIPDSPAWTLARTFIPTLNSGDPAAIQQYLERHLSETALKQQPAAERAAELVRLRGQLGALDAVEASGVPSAMVFNLHAAAQPRGADVLILIDQRHADRADEIRVHPGI